ncbi:FecR family protein [uncultured Sunxiuqinia sp.]|uniref:FecR family protein n=1 Tax=uncultured Sunxiuqinia sp. TaxID=1573825 RepID=UPI002AA686F0|nr:FecR family protein [uncultured Sunxiuqinia sp.]
MDLKRYKSYKTEELILDLSFIRLAKGEIVDGITLEQFQKYFPEKKQEIQLAITVVREIQSPKFNISSTRKDKVLNRILQQNRTQHRIIWFRNAVAAMLAIGLIAVSLVYMNKKASIVNFASTSQVQSSNTELILADGERVEIKSKEAKIEYTEDGTELSVNDTAKLEQETPTLSESFNQVNVPFGKRMSIHLSDGSIVHLNSGSRLIYPPAFDKKNREVFLVGEAYFEVSKDKTKPFVVRTDEFKVKVLGTKFAVQAFKKNYEYNALLVEGSVSLSKNSMLFSNEQILKPKEFAVLSKTKNSFNIKEVNDIENRIAWIHGYLIFKNENLTSLAEKVSRYYNIDIAVFTTNKTGSFSGKLDLKDEPERVIEGLATIFKVKYENQNGTIVFKN